MNKRWVFGAHKLVVETDAKYIKGMLEHPDMMPNATINRWIDEILMYHFVLRHKHQENALVKQGDPCAPKVIVRL